MVLGVDVTDHRAETDRRGSSDIGGFDGDVVGGDLAGIQRVLAHAIEAEQAGEALAVERVGGVGQYGGTHRAEVEALIELGDALGVAGEGIGVGEQIVGVGDRHRLNAVGIGRHQGIGVGGGEGQQALAGRVQGVAVGQHLATQGRQAVGGIDVLATAARVDQRGFRTDLVGHDLFQLEHVAGSLAVRPSALIDGEFDPAGDLASHLRGDDAFLGQHHDGRLVDAVQSVELVFDASNAGAAVGDGAADPGDLGLALGGGLAGRVGGVGGQRRSPGGQGDEQGKR